MSRKFQRFAIGFFAVDVAVLVVAVFMGTLVGYGRAFATVWEWRRDHAALSLSLSVSALMISAYWPRH
jgi:hypothetical protein